MGMVESSITCDGEGLLLLGTSLVVVEDDIGYESSEAKHGGSWRAHEGRRESEGVESAVNFLCRKYLCPDVPCLLFTVPDCSRVFSRPVYLQVPPNYSHSVNGTLDPPPQQEPTAPFFRTSAFILFY